jgi:2-polyprenyl-3-methyl-5-hydroxy-6-metoxy-1,4-benzoquinol methylase
MNNTYLSVINKKLFEDYRLEKGVWIKSNIADQGYATNFGLQWNEYQLTQFDSRSGKDKTKNRLFGCSGWHPESLVGKLVLEIGSGAGRFTEVLLAHGAVVVSVDLSNAVFANSTNNKHENLLLIRESLDNLPLNYFSFDYVLCYGVIQHTEHPARSYPNSIKFVKPNGMCAFDHYQKIFVPSPWYHPKYIWRPVTSRISPKRLLSIIQSYVPVYFPLDTAIKKIPIVGSILSGLIPIPCWNYTGVADVSQDYDNLIEWAIMDTFDALGAKYDEPWSLKELQRNASKLLVKSYHVGVGGNGVLLNTYGNTFVE